MAPAATAPYATASAKQNLAIPLIDFHALLSTSASAKAETSKAILSAFQEDGFLYLKNVPIAPSTRSNVFSCSKRFFEREQWQKDQLAWTTPSSNRGYVSRGREKVSSNLSRDEVQKEKSGNPDLKESFEIGREGVDGHPNQWPHMFDSEGAYFRKTMEEFFLECKEMHRLIMSAIAIGMGLDEHYFDKIVSKGDNNLRLLHYPSVKKDVFEKNKGQVRAGAHSDYGSITLLFQDMRGGLQVQTSSGSWLDVTPIEGTVVVNAGDLLARWSNDMVKSTKHRVVEPPICEEGVDEYPARYSVVYFCNPDFDAWIEALPGTWENDKYGKKYEGINCGDYLVQRLSATY
ncbi:hypothetical protein MMC11_004827 [Xylographa trunciseda]|nr:hypothetical protein [Xylographa trunciseda]